MKKFLFGILFLLISVASAFWAAKEAKILASGCKHGLSEVKNGFSVSVACEDAWGFYIGIFRASPLGAVKIGKWSLVDRFWSEVKWGSGVTSYIWSSDGKRLWVATDGVYGDPGVYELKVESRESKVIYMDRTKANQDEVGFTLKRLNQNETQLVFEQTAAGKKKIMELGIL